VPKSTHESRNITALEPVRGLITKEKTETSRMVMQQRDSCSHIDHLYTEFSMFTKTLQQQ